MQVNDVIQVIKTIVRYLLLCKLMMLYKLSNYCSYLLLCKYCSLSIVMQVNDVIQVIKTIVRYLLLCKLMMLYKLSRLLFVIYCYAS